MTSRLIAGLATAAVSATLVLGGVLPAAAAPGDWEEHDRVTGLNGPIGTAVLEGTPTLLYVTEPGANAIAVFNADTLDLIERVVFAGMNPTLVEVNPDTGVVYFVDAATWSVVRWDPAVTPVATIQSNVGEQITALEVHIADDDPTQSRVQWTVAYSGPSRGEFRSAPLDLSSVDVVDLGTGVFPSGLATLRGVDDSTSPPSVFHEVFVSDMYNDEVITVSGGTVTPTGRSPGALALAVGSTTLALATPNGADGTVTVFHGAGTAVVTTVPISSNPLSVEFAGASGPLFVTALDGVVSVIPAPFDTVEWTIPVGGFAAGGTYSTTLSRYFVAGTVGGDVIAIAQAPASTGGGDGGLAATGAADTAPALAFALGTVLLGVALAGVFRRRRRAEG